MGLSPSLRPYLVVNAILAGVILIIMGYSLFFSPAEDNYPVVCIHEKITGEKCPSCGMSHAFSLMVRGRFVEAKEWNPYSAGLFLFFVIQFVMRVVISIYLLSARSGRTLTGYADALVSVALAIILLYPLLAAQWRLITAASV